MDGGNDVTTVDHCAVTAYPGTTNIGPVANVAVPNSTFAEGVLDSFSAAPATEWSSPAYMRVYFAADEAALDASTTYCTGGVACSVDLTGMTAYDARYYASSDSRNSRGLPARL